MSLRAKIKKNASRLWLKETLKSLNKQYLNELPYTYRDYFQKLLALELLSSKGESFKVERQYNDRIVLRYSKEIQNLLDIPKEVVAIDIEAKYVEIVK